MKNSTSMNEVKTSEKKSKQHKQRFAVIRLYGQNIVLKHLGHKRYLTATPSELGVSGDRSSLSSEDIIALIDKKLDKAKFDRKVKIKINQDSADYSTLELAKNLSKDDMASICNLFMQLPLLTQNAVPSVTLMLFALAGKLLSTLHETYPDLRLVCGITPPNPRAMETLEALVESFNFNEYYKGKHFKAHQPLVVSPNNDFIGWGASAPSTRLADYSYVNISLKRGTATLFLPYRNTSAIIADGFQNNFSEAFIEHSPHCSVFLHGYSSNKLPSKIILNGDDLATVDADLLKKLQDNSKYLAALIDGFVKEFKTSEDMFEKLTKNVNEQLKLVVDDKYTSYCSSSKREMWVILLTLYEQLLNSYIAKGYCSADAAQNNLDIFKSSISTLMETSEAETAGKPVQTKPKEKIEELRIFLNFACEWIQRNRGNICLPNEETKSGSLAKLHDIDKKGRFMVFREEPLLEQYQWFCQLKNIDTSFCKSGDNRKLLAVFQKQDTLFHCNSAPRCKLKFHKNENDYVICIQSDRLLEHADSQKIELESVLAGLMGKAPTQETQER